MRDPRINFRVPELAALLAFLVPGAGHYYQGRRLKAGIYFSGIVSLFFGGMILGDWQPVYSQTATSNTLAPLQMQPGEESIRTKFSIGYGAQILVGLPALPALLQQSRFHSDPGPLNSLREEIDSEFIGAFRQGGHFVPVSGSIQLSPGEYGSAIGAFKGTMSDGTEVAVDISGSIELGRRVFGSPQRSVILTGLSGVKVSATEPNELRGSVRRSFANWYQAPRDTEELDRLHLKLSHKFDIAVVLTWIAGLLNLMAIWDAYDGPAYGYGDEEPEEADDTDS